MAIFYGYENTFTTDAVTKGPGGQIIGKTVTTGTYSMPEKRLKSEQKDTYVVAPLGGGFSGNGLKLISSDFKTCIWEGANYGPNGPLNQPRLLSSTTKTYGWKKLPTEVSPDPAPVWIQIAQQDEAFAYDGSDQLGRLTLHTTNKLSLQFDDSTGKWTLLPESTVNKSQTKIGGGEGGGWLNLHTDSVDWSASIRQSGADAIKDIGNAIPLPDIFTDSSISSGSRPGGVQSGG